MWQTHYVIARMRMAELNAAADQRRRWQLEDEANGRVVAIPSPGPIRARAARAVASLSKGSAALARRLDARLATELGPERLLRPR